MASIGPGARQLVESRRIGFIQHHCGPAAPGESPHHCVHRDGARRGCRPADRGSVDASSADAEQRATAGGEWRVGRRRVRARGIRGRGRLARAACGALAPGRWRVGSPRCLGVAAPVDTRRDARQRLHQRRRYQRHHSTLDQREAHRAVASRAVHLPARVANRKRRVRSRYADPGLRWLAIRDPHRTPPLQSRRYVRWRRCHHGLGRGVPRIHPDDGCRRAGQHLGVPPRRVRGVPRAIHDQSARRVGGRQSGVRGGREIEGSGGIGDRRRSAAGRRCGLHHGVSHAQDDAAHCRGVVEPRRDPRRLASPAADVVARVRRVDADARLHRAGPAAADERADADRAGAARRPASRSHPPV